MATLTLISGSIFNGSPIVFQITPAVPNTNDASPSAISFHRVILEIECGMSGGNYEVLKMSAPVSTTVPDASPSVIEIDISSALRTFRDSYEYTPNAATYPLVKFNVKCYDEYMLDGEVYTTSHVYYPFAPDQPTPVPDASPSGDTHICTIFGSLSDTDRRLASSEKPSVQRLSRKPTTSPQIVKVGETHAYTSPYSEPQSLTGNLTLAAPQSHIANVTTAGSHTLGYQPIYALPANDPQQRTVFRFINSYGVLESISVPIVHGKDISITTNKYAPALQQTIKTLSRTLVRKQRPTETWKFTTDPLDEPWLYWYLHEFFLSEHVWMEYTVPAPTTIPDASPSVIWLPVQIIPEETITYHDRTQSAPHQLTFSAELS